MDVYITLSCILLNNQYAKNVCSELYFILCTPISYTMDNLSELLLKLQFEQSSDTVN
jgi:hypothetical protein